MFSGTWAKVGSFIVLVVLVTSIDVVAFYGAQKAGFSFFQFSPETAADLTTSEPQDQITRSQRDSSFDHLNSLTSGLAATATADRDSASSSHLVAEFYPVCVILSIGDDSNFPNAHALPFSLLYRLFDAAKEEVSKARRVQLDKLRLEKGAKLFSAMDKNDPPMKMFVGVDYTSVACKMARDSLQDAGPEFEDVGLKCQTLGEVKNQTLAYTSRNSSNELESFSRVGCRIAIVGGSSRYVSQISVQWAELVKWENFRVVDLDKPDFSHNSPALPRELWRPTVVTSFSSNHIAVGLLLLRSLGKAGKEVAAAGHYNISIVVYTLEDFNSTLQGIVDCLVHELNEDYKVQVEIRRFDFSAYPSWMTINQTRGYGKGGTGEYAWKVVMIHTVLAERGFILWTDAGCRYNAQGLVESLNYIRDVGFATKWTVGMVPEHVHPSQMKFFRYHVRYDLPRVKNCDGSGIGFTLDKYESLARPFYDCGVTRQCIAPDGSSRLNHRQDQAALTLLADMTGNRCQGISSRVRRHMDSRPRDYSGTIPTHCYQDPLQV